MAKNVGSGETVIRDPRVCFLQALCLAVTMTDEVFDFANGFLVWFFKKGPKKIVSVY